MISRAERIYRSKLRDRIALLKMQRGCVDCGYDAHPAALDFDHRTPTMKIANISRMMRDRYSWARICAEIDKCDLRCSNCHRVRTAQAGHNGLLHADDLTGQLQLGEGGAS